MVPKDTGKRKFEISENLPHRVVFTIHAHIAILKKLSSNSLFPNRDLAPQYYRLSDTIFFSNRVYSNSLFPVKLALTVEAWSVIHLSYPQSGRIRIKSLKLFSPPSEDKKSPAGYHRKKRQEFST